VTAPATRWENPSEPWWPYSGTKLETADTAKESLQLLGLLYSEGREKAFDFLYALSPYSDPMSSAISQNRPLVIT